MTKAITNQKKCNSKVFLRFITTFQRDDDNEEEYVPKRDNKDHYFSPKDIEYYQKKFENNDEALKKLRKHDEKKI